MRTGRWEGTTGVVRDPEGEEGTVGFKRDPGTRKVTGQKKDLETEEGR